MFGLEYPRSLGTYQTSSEAQTVVDRLSDAEFPVEKIRIVGTDLRQIERVTGRLTWTKVLLSGLVQGLLLGLFIGLLFALFSVAPIAQLVAALAIGAFFGVIMAALSYGMTGGQRDFTSVTAIVPMRFEILTEHNVVDQALAILREAGRPDAPQMAPATGPRVGAAADPGTVPAQGPGGLGAAPGAGPSDGPGSGRPAGPSYGQPAPPRTEDPGSATASGYSRPAGAPSFGQPAPSHPTTPPQDRPGQQMSSDTGEDESPYRG
jgi:hypothetical protein